MSGGDPVVEKMWKRTLLFTALFPGTVCVVLPALILRLGARGVGIGSRWTVSVGLLLIGAGVVGYVHCASAFVAEGKGTPAPYDPPRRLVRGGLYRAVRNPMYLAVLLVLLGEAVLFGSVSLLLYTAVVATAFHLRVVLYEEPRLRELFPEQFAVYQRSVPRWVPNLRS